MERVLGQASIDIRAKDKNFRDDLKRMLRNIKDVAIDVNLIPQTQKAENDIKNFVNNENKKKHTIKVNVKVDFNDARQKIKEFKDSEASKKPGTVKFDAKVNFSEARKSISDFSKEQSNRKPITLKAKMTFAEARKDIRNFRDSLKPITLKSKISVDPKEANDVIRDVRTKQSNATPTLLRMKAVVSFGDARKQLAAFKKEVRERNKALILVDANTKRAEDSFRRMERSLQKDPIYVPVRYVNESTGEVDGGPSTGDNGVLTQEALATLRTQLDPVSAAILEAQIKALSRDRVTKNRVVADVDSSSAARAESTLNTIARDRTSTIRADVDRDSVRSATREFYRQYNDMFGDSLGRKMNRNPISMWLDRSGWGDTLKSFGTALTGTVPFDWIRDGIKNIMGDMEGLSTQAGKVVTAFGAIGTAVSAAGGFAVNLVADISQVAGIAALVPAALAANQFRVWTKQMAFSGMQTAIFSNNVKAVKEALAGMSPVMRNTAEYLRGFMGELQDLTQTSYWDTMGTEIRATAEILKGTLFKGFEDLAEIMALNHIEVLKQVVAFEKMGRFKETFDNINEAFERMRPAIGDSTEALLTLIYEGSKKLPELSDHLNFLAEKFNDFIQESSKNGAILGWIDTAMRRISELGKLVWDTVRIIGAIGEAAEKAGLGGLTELTDAFDKLADYATSPKIQSILIDVFRDSKIGVGQLADGLGSMWDGFLSKMPEVTQIFIDASSSVGGIMEGIGTMFRDSTMMDGFTKLSGSVRKAIENLEPAFKYIGDIIGDLAEMGGVIIENLAPGIETAAKMIHAFLEGFKDGFVKLVPVLQGVAEAFHHLFMTPVRLAGEALGGLMTIISQMPTQVLMFVGAMGMITPAVAGLFKIKSLIATLVTTEATGRLAGFIGTIKGIGTAGSKMGKGFSNGFRTIRRGAAITTAGVKTSFSSMGSNIAASAAASVGAFDVSNRISDKAKSGASGVSTAWKGVKTQAKGVGKIFGGLAGAFKPFLPGAAIAVGAGVIVTAFADAQAGADAAKESVKNLADAFVSDGFVTGEQYLHNLDERMKEIGTDWFTDWNWSDTFMESAEKVGISADKIKDIFSGTKEEVEASAGSWNHFAVEADKAYSNAAASGNGYFDRTKVLHGVIDSLSKETLDGLKVSAEELKRMAAEDPGAFKKTIEGMKQLSEEQLEALNNIKDLDEELTALSNKDFDIIPSSVWKDAQDGNESLKQALMDSNTQVERMSENFEILKDKTSTYEQKLSAFKDNLKLSGAETFSDTGGLKEYYANLDQVSNSYDKIKDSIKGNIDELIRFDSSSGKMTTEFQFQTQAARDLHDSLSKHAEGIQGVSVAAYDSALRSGKGIQEAVQSAKDASAPMVEEMKQNLRDMGITSEEQINAIIDDLGLLPEDIEMALDVEGADEAKRQIVETQLAAEAIASEDYTAYLRVMTDDAKNALKDFLGVADLNNEVKVKAALERKGFDMDYDEFMAKVAMSSDPINLVAQLQDEASSGLSSIQKEKESLESRAEIPVSVKNEYDAGIRKASEALSILKNNPTDMKVRTNAQEAASEALTALKKIQEENPDIDISATITELENAVGSAKSMLFSIEDRKAIISAVDKATPVGFAWNSMSVENKEAVLGVVDEFSSKITGFNSMTLKDQNAVIRAIDEAKPKADAWQALTLEEKKAILSVTDHASGYVDAYNNNKKIMDKHGNMLPRDEVSAVVDNYNINKHLADKVGDFLLGTDQVSAKLDSINTKELYDKVVEVYGEDNASAMFEYIRGLPLPDREMLLKAIDAGASGNHKFINSLPYNDRMKELSAKDKNAQRWHDIINKLPYIDRDKKLTATDLATKVHDAVNRIPHPGKDWLLTATDWASNKVRDVNNMKINNKSFSITAVVKSVVGSVNSAVSSARSWANRVFKNEDGAIYNGRGVQTFADGGVTMSKAMKSIQAFSGGSERHVAQIARGQFPYRVWAEPETGGEAYIPLAKSKRKRSMRILEQVARHFGTNLMKFNNGGVYKGKSIGGGVMSYASGGSDLAEALANDRKAIADGFNSLKLDIKSMFGATEKSPLGKSMEGIEKTLRDFASEYRRSAPGERAKALKALARVTAQSKTSSFWGRWSDLSTSNVIAKDARSRAYTSRLQYNPRYTLADMEKAVSTVSSELEKQRAVLEKRISNRDSMKSSIANALFSDFSISNTMQSADSTGWRPPTSAADVNSYVQKKLANMKKFGSKITALSKAGYNKSIVSEIAQMNPEDGIYMAEALLKDKSFLSSINKAYTTMFGAEGNMNTDANGDSYVGGLAGSIGKRISNEMYGAGIAASEGLVNGLTKNLTALERAARFMAEALTKSFKGAMGIKSPSRVMMNLAKFIPQGVALGIDGGRSEVSKSMGRLVNPYDLRLTSGSSDLHTSKSNGIMGGRTSAGAVVNVYPSQGLSETQIGEAASRELLYRLDY